MQFSQKLANHGFKITFVHTDFNHERVMNAISECSRTNALVKLASIPDGLGPEDDRNDLAKLCLAILSTMPSLLEKLIQQINGLDGGSNRITCIFADVNMAWALEVANKLGMKGAILCPSSAAIFAIQDKGPKLIHDGILDSDGFPIIKGKFQLSPSMPMMDTTHIPWCCIGDTTSQKIIYDYIMQMRKASYFTDWWLCNTTSELEPEALSLSPKFQPIGPLMEFHETCSLGQLWQEDLSCLSWLDQQPPRSVIYVAFGSFTIFDLKQFKELILGLELTNRPFLLVVRSETKTNSNTENIYPDGFPGNRGKIVKWAPQQKVLSHPALACFISHCGWNSTIEGLSNGLPFLCWPYFADQFYNKAYICDDWKVGLGFDIDEKGLISREEVKKKVDQLLGDENLRARSMKLKEMIMNNIAEGGRSYENFSRFIKWIKE
ncbi:hypothetical protein L6164_007538 [Bauhinia variegata]|uniref:Uncharacterized protein n=1 Tax=Bauhinia variegata TaxID=167791 RepID=A0ACB9PD55_BAUVA|nr:hypothetical protein L6164_007538 [Bauhinia variegata]